LEKELAMNFTGQYGLKIFVKIGVIRVKKFLDKRRKWRFCAGIGRLTIATATPVAPDLEFKKFSVSLGWKLE
jgi:hypothetical protein